MKASFSEVLARETASLGSVVDTADLDRWRSEVVDLAGNVETAYAQVLRPIGDREERAAFLDSWRDLIAGALARVAKADPCARARLDPGRMAVSILAALHGGAVLSRVERDSRPLRASVELALAPLLLPAEITPGEPEKAVPSVP